MEIDTSVSLTPNLEYNSKIKYDLLLKERIVY